MRKEKMFLRFPRDLRSQNIRLKLPTIEKKQKQEQKKCVFECCLRYRHLSAILLYLPFQRF